MEKVAAEGLTADELSQAKRRLRGLMVFGQESMAQRMLSVGRSMLLLDRVVPLDEVLEQIEAVTNDDIVSVGEEVFRDGNEAIVALGPFRKNGGVQ
jgi:predicted Zn-dependent peptidase